MLIAQITDLHVVENGARAYGDKVDTNAMLSLAIERLNRLSPKPDLVVATGDLTDHGRPEQYVMLRELLARIEAPVAVLIGNHDAREPFREHLGHYDYLPAEGPLHYALETEPVRFVALDSTSDASHEGEFCAARAAWLDACLSAKPDTPTVVALHHPPLDTGIKWMDGKGAGWAASLVDTLARHPHVVRVMCGHLHRPIFAQIGGRAVSVSPSTAHQVALDLTPEINFDEKLPEFELEPPGLQLHLWDGKCMLTHTMHIGEWERVLPISRELMIKLMRAHQEGGQSALTKATPW